MAGRCEAKTKSGKPCGAAPQTGKRLCAMHDPAMAKRVAAGRRKGAQVANAPRIKTVVLPPTTPDLKLATAADVKALLAETINQARTGRLAVSVANCIGQLAGVLIKVIPGADFEARLQTLEARRAE